MEHVTVESRLQHTQFPMTRLNSTSSDVKTTGVLPPPTPTMAPQSSIPLFYRLTLLYFEPFFALGGALILHFHPSTFLTTMTPSPATTALTSIRVLTDQLAAMQVLLAFNTGVLLRFAAGDEDRRRRNRLWRICCAGMLICDVLHGAASVMELGWEVVLAPGRWRAEEWVNFGIMGWMALVRLAVVFGVGMGDERREQRRGRAVGEDPAKGIK